MSYLKKVLVFDEIGDGFGLFGKRVSGVLRIQKNGNTACASIYVTNLNRNFADSLDVVLCVGKKVYLANTQSLEASLTLQSLTPNDDVCCLVAVVQEGVRIPLAYATNNNRIDWQTLKCHLKNTQEVTKYEEFICATQNFYADKLDLDKIRQNSTQKFKPIEMLSNCKQTDGQTFFANAKQTLQNIFESYPPCDELNDNIKNSFFVCVPYNTDKFFAVGLVERDDKPKYVCYAVPGKSTTKPTDDSFSFFATKNKEVGFWVLCQDTTTGLQAKKPYEL